MSPRLFSAVLAAATLILTGCLPESKNPLSTPSTSTVDPRLEGIYVAKHDKSGDDLQGWHFHYRAAKGAGGQMHPTPSLEVLSVEHEKDGGLKGAAYHALTTHLGGRDYMSFVEMGSGAQKGKASPYSFARYEVDWSGTLRVWLADPKALAAAIKAGKLHGTVTPHKTGDDIYIADSTEGLAAFVTASDPNVLFSGKPLVFYRLAR